MGTPNIFYPKVTDAGLAAAISVSGVGLQLTLTEVSFGTGQYSPTGAETALFNEVKRIPIAGATRPQPNRLRAVGVWSELEEASEIGEIGFWVGGTLFAVWSQAVGGPVGFKTPGVEFVAFFELVFEEVPANSITIAFNPLVPEALAAVVTHEVDDMAHPQYLRRADFVSAHSLMTAVAVGGTADAITLTLPTESAIPAYAFGQRVVFIAGAANTGPVTVNVSGRGVKAVTAGGAALGGGELVAGAAYTLFYDGTAFQVTGGIGGGATPSDYYTETEADDRFLNVSQAAVLAPPGLIGHFARDTAPTGWLKANGALVSRTTYANLFAAIGIRFGAGDGATTFRLPDLRGEFIRGWSDDRAGVDAGRGLGSTQADELKAHSHTYGRINIISNGERDDNPQAGDSFNEAAATGFTGGSETRPRNVAMLACIKF